MLCKGYVYEKQYRLPFSKTSKRTRVSLELVYADLFGPTNIPTIQSSRHFFFIVDNFTRMM